MCLDPMVIESIKHVHVFDALVLSVLNRRKRNTETVLIMVESNVGAIRQRALHTFIDARTHESVMDLQVLKIYRHIMV